MLDGYTRDLDDKFYYPLVGVWPDPTVVNKFVI